MKNIFVILVLLAAPTSWPKGSLSDLVSRTDIIPYGVIKAIDNHSEGNSSLLIHVGRYDFNDTSEEEMTIFYNETAISRRFYHNFSLGEDKYSSSRNVATATISSQTLVIRHT
jgi:hypothetical protein